MNDPKIHNKRDQKRNHGKAVDKLPVGRCALVADRYEKIGRIGEGTYGVVYKAVDRHTNHIVALKRCIPHHESSDGFPVTSKFFAISVFVHEWQTFRRWFPERKTHVLTPHSYVIQLCEKSNH